MGFMEYFASLHYSQLGMGNGVSNPLLVASELLAIV
mgnify:CR=1 FL=1